MIVVDQYGRVISAAHPLDIAAPGVNAPPYAGTPGQVLAINAAGTALEWVSVVPAVPSILDATINIVIDGGGVVLTTGIKVDLIVDFACTILSATLLADVSGSIVLDIWKDTYSNYPPTVADTITAAAKPTLSGAIKSQDTTLTGWTTTIVAGNTIRVNVDSVATVTRVLLALKVRRT